MALRRARHRCEQCGARDSLVVHHLGPSASPLSAVVLCRSCHAITHGIERGYGEGDARTHRPYGVGGHHSRER